LRRCHERDIGSHRKPKITAPVLDSTDQHALVGKIWFNLYHQALHDIYISEIKNGEIFLLVAIPAKDLKP